MDFSQAAIPYLKQIDESLVSSVVPDLPETLSEPILYFLKMPAKKVRPLSALFAAKVVGGNVEDALPAATAIELFHDFTLVHDDIMDLDELRRGFQTMHVKYGNSTAILVGDAMIGLAFQQLMKSPQQYLVRVANIFSEALVKVCEGQALDKEFETRDQVSTDEYIDMIAKKTAWLIQVSCSLGAICGGGTEEQIEQLTRFGYLLGLGFQIQDDLLDFVADEEKLGKTVGSDFRMDKKTYVTLKYREIIQQDSQLREKYPLKPMEFESFGAFQDALRELGIVDAVQTTAQAYIADALTALESVHPLNDENPLYLIAQFLQNRQY